MAPVGNFIEVEATAQTADGSTPAFDYFVDPKKGDDSNNGLTPATAFQTVEAAVSAVGTAGGKHVGLMSGSHGLGSFDVAFSAETIFESIIPQGASFSLIRGTGTENCTFKNLKVFLSEENSSAKPNPNNAPDLINIDSPVDVTFDGLDISAEKMLRAFYGIVTTGATAATRVTVKNCTLSSMGAGIRFSQGAADCVVEDNTIHKIVGSAFGHQGSADGLIYRRNTVYDQFKRPNDPEWTAGDVNDVGTWGSIHASLIAVREAQNVTIEDNLFYSIGIAWIQLYSGDNGPTNPRQYGNIEIKRNLWYDCTGLRFVSLGATDTEMIGPIIIENNTAIGSEKGSWDPENYTELRERVDNPNMLVTSFPNDFAGDSCKNNLIFGRSGLPSWSNNNVTWYQPAGSAGTANVFVEIDHNSDPDWISDQLVAGTFLFEPITQEVAKPGYTFQPKAGSFLATGGEGGTHIGATPPPA